MQGDLLKVKEDLKAAAQAIETLLRYPDLARQNSVLAAAHQVESACITLRNFYDKSFPQTFRPLPAMNCLHSTEIYGEIELTDNGWLHIKLPTLLTHHNKFNRSPYIADSISRLVNNYFSYGGRIPFYQQAFVAIIEHCTTENCSSYDHDNKDFCSALNALKGWCFPDDNQFVVSLGMFTSWDAAPSCHIYVLPHLEIKDFLSAHRIKITPQPSDFSLRK